MGSFDFVKLCLVPLRRGGEEAHSLPNTLQCALGYSASLIGPSL